MQRVTRIASLVFLIMWALVLFLDYWQKHPVYYFAIQHFRFWGLGIFLLLATGGAAWLAHVIANRKKPLWYINGLSVLLLFLALGTICTGFAYNQTVQGKTFGAGHALHVFVQLAGTALALAMIVTAAYTLGDLVNKRLKINAKGTDETVLAFATGIMCIVLVMFLIGAVSLLYSFVLFPLFALLFLFGRKAAFRFLKISLWLPYPTDKHLHWAGGAGFFLLLVLMAVNFTSVNVPMPAGFDSLTLYANLPALIGQHHGLVEGFQPYNWSLLMSLGHILFDSVKINLALSWLGGTLALYALYALCRNWLRMNVNHTLWVLLVFALMPAFHIQASAELKVDLGLLFIYLSILLVLLAYFTKTKTGAEDLRPELVLMGLLSGFALGTKLTTVYFALALVCGAWYLLHGSRGFFAAFLASLFLVFLFKIDEFGGLRQYHIGVENMQWGLLAGALLLLAGIFIENRERMATSFRHTLLYGAFAALPFLPWMAKNYVDSGSLSPQVLLNGIQPSPDIHLQKLEKGFDQ